MKNGTKALIALMLAILALLLGVSLGSASLSPADALMVLMGRGEGVSDVMRSIVLKIRLPRVLLAFVVGAALSVSGTVMQSVLRNPLASSFTLGVSSGASLGAALATLGGFAYLGLLARPLMGFGFGMGTVFLAMGLTAALDQSMENNTIVLVGMVFSLFVDSVLTLVTSLSAEHLKELVFWQMGSFSGRGFGETAIVALVTALGLLMLMRFNWELDLMTFGEEQALSSGVALKGVKLLMIAVSALLTGVAVAFTGTIGFIDLIAPHLVRKVFGARHKIVLPMAAVMGGAFMVVSDLLARTIMSPRELPVGAVTALVGAPFFTYVYFARRRRDAKG